MALLCSIDSKMMIIAQSQSRFMELSLSFCLIWNINWDQGHTTSNEVMIMQSLWAFHVCMNSVGTT